MLIQNNNFKQIFVNLIVLFLPISFILGNLVLNLNVAFLIISVSVIGKFSGSPYTVADELKMKLTSIWKI